MNFTEADLKGSWILEGSDRWKRWWWSKQINSKVTSEEPHNSTWLKSTCNGSQIFDTLLKHLPYMICIKRNGKSVNSKYFATLDECYVYESSF